MRIAKDIADAICREINDRFSTDAVTVAGVHYDISRTIGGMVSSFLNSWNIEHDKFGIVVGPDKLVLSIVSPEAKTYVTKVEGLAGILVRSQLDTHSNRYEYLMVDPTSIDRLFDKLETLFNQEIDVAKD